MSHVKEEVRVYCEKRKLNLANISVLPVKTLYVCMGYSYTLSSGSFEFYEIMNSNVVLNIYDCNEIYVKNNVRKKHKINIRNSCPNHKQSKTFKLTNLVKFDQGSKDGDF